MSSKIDLLNEWYRRIWKEKDLAAIHELFQPDGAAFGLMEDLSIGPDEFAVFASAFHELVEEVDFEVAHSIEQDGWIAAVVQLTARNPASGVKVSGNAMTFARIRDNKIVEAFNQFDAMSFFEQMELLPPDAFGICLMGERIG